MSYFRQLAERLNPRGLTGRRAYTLAGITLLAVKMIIDRIVVSALGGRDYWSALGYWLPSAVGRPGETIPPYAAALLVTALPFIAIGVVLTLRRLRDVGWPGWLSVVFFVPAVNFVLFVLLALLPSRETPRGPGSAPGVLGWLAQRLILRNPALSAAVAIVLTVMLMVPLTWVATSFFRNYGWGIFVAQPFMLGLLAAVIHAAPGPRSWGSCVGVGMLALAFCGAAILAVALEGAVCLLMAAPLAAPLVLLGATIGYFLQQAHWNAAEQATRLYAAGWLALPLAFGAEWLEQPEPRLMAVTTAVVIAAPRAVVWQHVVTFAELPPPAELVFRSGIAYPLRATIAGRGVGAVRRCEFSTGPFVEPITAWDEPNRLAFDVIEQPHPMQEWSPYRALQTPHLEGFFRSRQGEFRLVALADGRTRLEGTTWYTQRFWPAPYWQHWSDYLVHTIHQRVLEHIRQEAELAAK